MSAAALAWPVAVAGAALAAALAVELRRRAELVARACHELRGPLTAAHLALHGAAVAAGPSSLRVEAAGFELRRAGRALEDLAAARRGARAGDRSEPVELGELLRAQAAAWEAVARAAGAELRVGPVPPAAVVHGDPVRIAQALGNVVANAIEHGGGVVRVQVGRAAGRVRVEVADGGPGLPASVSTLARRPRAGR
ncbi:MAG TPA: ATP-binding protein, partial [Solirubrobacteraceae bacterium]|nr:ATP-binding protein [Solirubrobacteraceae bacterium]